MRRKKLEEQRTDHGKYNYFRRDPESTRKYNSKAWKECRKAYIREHPTCERCRAHGVIIPAEEVHHVKPIREGGSLTDPDNLEALCHACHMAAHGFRGRGAAQINVVYGPPCGGKTTYVQGVRYPEDVVWDMDMVMAAISGRPIHSPAMPGHVEIVQAMRDAVITQALRERCPVKRVWVIITNPWTIEEKLRGHPSVAYFRVNSNREICLQRAREQERGEEVERAIKRWYDKVRGVPGEFLVG